MQLLTFGRAGAVLVTEGDAGGVFVDLTAAGAEKDDPGDQAFYCYTLAHEATPASYDESMAVACLQGIAMHSGVPFPPAEMRLLLMSTGTPQADDPVRPKSQHIGPLPNLEKAIDNF